MRILRFIKTFLIAYFLTVAALTVCYLFIAPVSTVMLGSWLRGAGMEREWVSLRHVSTPAIRAVLASEDGRFCQHYGIDWLAMRKVMAEAKRRGRTPSKGASTISMQVAKNLFLFNGRSWVRKALEAPIALWIDFAWPKQRVLEVYLNIAEWGDGVFGIQAASRRAYGIPASQLTSYQAAMLAVVLPDPDGRNARYPGPAMRGMAASVQARMGHEPNVAYCVGR